MIRFAHCRDLRRDDRGQDLIEYAVIATFVALLAVIGAATLNSAIGTLYDRTSHKVDKGANFSTNGSATTTGCTPPPTDQAATAPPAPVEAPAHPDEAHTPPCK